MATNPIEDIKNMETATVATLAAEYNVTLATLTDEADYRRQVREHLINALELIGPQTMDDTVKYNTVQRLITTLVIVARDHDTEEMQSIDPNEQLADAHNHYNPLGEVSDLEEQTVEALGEQYNIQDELATSADLDTPFRIQHHLGGALLELAPAWFAHKDRAVQSILTAMLATEITDNDVTRLSIETGTDNYTIEVDGETKEQEFEVPKLIVERFPDPVPGLDINPDDPTV